MSRSHYLLNSMAQTQVPMSVDVLVELAKNAVNPIKCEWGAGTKVECNIMLNSWILLKKHLCALHCHATKDGFLCRLPRCNCQLHSSHSAFAEHIESAHLSRLLFSCPLNDCEVSSLKGTESLVKHYREHHRDLDGQVLKYPVKYLTWKPFPQPQTAGEGVVDVPLPPLPPGGRIGPGRILVDVARHSKSTLDFRTMTLGEDNPTPSQGSRLSQELEMVSSQGILPMTRRKRIKPRQLEKPEKEVAKKVDMESDEVSSVTLDDLTRLGAQSDLIGPNIPNDHSSDTGGDRGGLKVTRRRGVQVQGVADVMLKKRVDINMVFAERSSLVDLSQPQPMLRVGRELDGGINRGLAGDHETLEIMGMQKTILFEALMRRVDEMERAGVAVDVSLM